MKIFATLDSLSQNATNAAGFKNKFVYGAWVASETFYHALLKYGSFDEYHFFVSSPAQSRIIKKDLSALNLNLDKIKLINISDLPSCLEKIRYTVFFSADLGIWRLAYLRKAYAKSYFPICGINHSFSYGFMLRDIFFQNMVSNLEKFDSIICSSNAVRTAIHNLYSELSSSLRRNTGMSIRYNGRLDRLPLGVEANEFGKISKSKARQALGINKNKLVILYFGRLSLFDKADLYPVLLVFKEIVAEKKNVLLLLAGADAQDKYGRRLKNITQAMGLSDSVKFVLPWVKDKASLYSAADIFISPADSIQESFGLTILEAMASGLPAVASDWDGYKDIIVHNKTGLRVPTYWTDGNIEDGCLLQTILDSWQYEHLYLAQSVSLDVNKLKEYLLLLVNNKELRLKFGENAKARVIENFDWKVVIPAFEELWLRLSKLAQRHKVIRNKKNLFMPEYLDCFSHYATKILDNRSRLAIDKNGLEFLKAKKFPFKLQKELLDVISIKIIFIILTFMLQKNVSTISQIEGNAKKALKLKPAVLRYNIMWMLKKGLLRLA